MDKAIQEYMKEISSEENIDLNNFLDRYYRKLEKCFREYKNNEGYEDYKMNYIDFIVLYSIWKSLNLRGYIESYLIIMYSYYKLEDFHFPVKKFKSGFKCIQLITDTNVILIINSLINF